MFWFFNKKKKEDFDDEDDEKGFTNGKKRKIIHWQPVSNLPPREENQIDFDYMNFDVDDTADN